MRRTILLAATFALTTACTQGEQPPPAPAPGAAVSTSALAQTSASASVAPSVPDAGSDATIVVDATAQGEADAAASLFEADGAPLGQTDAFPSITSASYEDRIKLLWSAIVQDDPARAKPAFFPLVAYEQVKAIPKPAIDYERRLLAAFARDIHAYHQKLGKEPDKATFVRLDVPEAKAKWMDPGTEGNKLGYDRVLDSKLIVKRDDGKELKLDVKSMISWRGEWYVVHLAGFK